jgi:phosphotransferase system IIA component
MNSLILISPSKGEAFNQFFLVKFPDKVLYNKTLGASVANNNQLKFVVCCCNQRVHLVFEA